jgi:hypothetical protein
MDDPMIISNDSESSVTSHWQTVKKQLLSVLGEIKSLPIEQRLSLFLTLQKYVRNILSCNSAATLERFSKVPCSNSTFQKTVETTVVGPKLMLILGFTKQKIESSLSYEQSTGNKEQDVYVLEHKETTIPVLKKCEVFLSKNIQRWRVKTADTVITYKGKTLDINTAIVNFQQFNLHNDWKAGLEAIGKYLINIIAYPTNNKFRNIPLLGKGFGVHVGQFTGAFDLMRAIGFDHLSNGLLSIHQDKTGELPNILKLIQQCPDQPASQMLNGKIPRVERFVAVFVCAGVGDAIAYNNGYWNDPEKSGEEKFKDCQSKGGIVHLGGAKFTLTAGTNLLLSAGEALLKGTSIELIVQKFLSKILDPSKNYSLAGKTKEYLSARKVFTVTGKAVTLPAVRALAIGSFYWHHSQLDNLIKVTAILTHLTDKHISTTFNALTSALFTSFALQGVDNKSWGVYLLKALPRIREILHACSFSVEELNEQFSLFEDQWNRYMHLRKISESVTFPPKYDFSDRDAAYASNFSIGREKESDICLIAYDALLWASQKLDRSVLVNRQQFFNDGSSSWFELLEHSAMYKGSNTSSSAALACAWYGAQNGLRGIPVQNYKSMESIWRMQNIGGAMESASNRF